MMMLELQSTIFRLVIVGMVELTHCVTVADTRQPRGWVQTAWVKIARGSPSSVAIADSAVRLVLQQLLSPGTRNFMYDATVSCSGTNCSATVPNQHPWIAGSTQVIAFPVH